MSKTEKIRAALELDSSDRLVYGGGVSGRGWYLQRFGQSERYLGASWDDIKDCLEDLVDRRAAFERERAEMHRLYDLQRPEEM